jgi:hypothetical protein
VRVTTCAISTITGATAAAPILMFVQSLCMKYLSTTCVSSIAIDATSLCKMLNSQMYISMFSFCVIL